MEVLEVSHKITIPLSDLIDLAERAFSPDELTHLPILPPSSEDRHRAEKLLERWEKLIQAKSGKQENFERRLASLNLDRDSALERLQIRRSLQVENLPSWAKRLYRILNEAPYPCSAKIQNLLAEISVTDTPLFPEFLHPFVSHYIGEFLLICQDWNSFIESQVLKQLVADLLKRLSFLCARTVAADIKQKRVLGLLKGKTSQERYQYYVNHILGTKEGLFNLLRGYPVLGRLLTTVTEQAIQNSSQWLRRLAFDSQAIAQTFTQGKKIGRVVNLNLSLSEPHAGGQTVWSVTFSSGLRLAYKCRSLALDVAYIKLLAWLNQIQPDISLDAAPVLPGEDYGWVLWIEPFDCENQEQVAQFYRRQGAHLAVFYFLSGTDFHEENFIAAGSWPIPIDLEGIGSVALTFTMGELVNIPPYLRPTFASVTSTGALPRWINNQNFETEAIVISGITGRENVVWPIPRGIWHNLGTDQISLTYEHVLCKPALPLPKLEGKPVKIHSFLEQLLDGFTHTYQNFINHRDLLLSNDSPLAAFKNLPTRVLLRNTEDYLYLLFWSTAPDQLTSGAAYDVGLEFVCGNPIDDQNRKDSLAFGTAEKQALWQRDVPYFLGSTDGRYVGLNYGKRFEPVNKYTGYDIMQQRLKEASKVDLNWQQQLIRALFEMSMIPPGSCISLSGKVVEPITTVETDNILAAKIHEHLLALGETLAKLVVRHTEGIGWLTMSNGSSGLMPYIFYPMPWSPAGAAGTAVFLANLAAYTGNSSWSALALEATKTSANMLLHYDKHPLIGSLAHQGLLGSATVIYALLVCAERLGDESCLELAYELVMRLSIQEWEQVKNPDILNGSASSLLTLIHLYQHQPKDELLERACAVGRGILRYQNRDGLHIGGFKVPNFSRPLLGMAHGSAGIAYALSKLYTLTQDHSLLSAIHATLAYERSHYNHDYQDWPSLQHGDNPPVFMSGWCAGAPGIGLARLGMLGRFNDDLMPEIEVACQATLQHLSQDSHHLCCGETGRIIFLINASQQLNRPELHRAAAQAITKMLDFYEQNGYWKLQLISTRSIIPGLTDGIAGIGLSLLTFLDPAQTSNFLTLS